MFITLYKLLNIKLTYIQVCTCFGNAGNTRTLNKSMNPVFEIHNNTTLNLVITNTWYLVLYGILNQC